MTAIWLILVLPAAFALAITLLNIATWPRLRGGNRRAGDAARVSVLVPARNEAANLSNCVDAVLSSGMHLHEVIVCDDRSEDETAAIVRAAQRRDPRVKLIAGREPGPGWIGKPHACHQLAQAATGDVLLFVDADVSLTNEGLAAITQPLASSSPRGSRADVVTAVPKQQVGSVLEALIIPLLHVTYMSWLPLMLIPRTRDPRLLAANGQLLALTRETYNAIGGFASVRNEIVDDMALCRRAKEQGKRVLFADGHLVASCRMYRSAGALWNGFCKNIYEGIGGTPVALALVLTLFVTTFVAPYLAVVLAALIWPALWAPALVGVALNITLRFALAVRHQQPAFGVVTHPAGVLILMALAVSSFRASRNNNLQWAGRVYAAKPQRLTASAS